MSSRVCCNAVLRECFPRTTFFVLPPSLPELGVVSGTDFIQRRRHCHAWLPRKFGMTIKSVSRGDNRLSRWGFAFNVSSQEALEGQ